MFYTDGMSNFAYNTCVYELRTRVFALEARSGGQDVNLFHLYLMYIIFQRIKKNKSPFERENEHGSYFLLSTTTTTTTTRTEIYECMQQRRVNVLADACATYRPLSMEIFILLHES